MGKENPIQQSLICAAFAVFLTLQMGCNQRKLAPPLQYSDDNVQAIRDEIKQMDWE